MILKYNVKKNCKCYNSSYRQYQMFSLSKVVRTTSGIYVPGIYGVSPLLV